MNDKTRFFPANFVTHLCCDIQVFQALYVEFCPLVNMKPGLVPERHKVEEENSSETSENGYLFIQFLPYCINSKLYCTNSSWPKNLAIGSSAAVRFLR